jgi:hypothetical protein
MASSVHLGRGFAASAQNPSSVSTVRTPEKPAAVSASVNPLFGLPRMPGKQAQSCRQVS